MPLPSSSSSSSPPPSELWPHVHILEVVPACWELLDHCWADAHLSRKPHLCTVSYLHVCGVHEYSCLCVVYAVFCLCVWCMCFTMTDLKKKILLAFCNMNTNTMCLRSMTRLRLPFFCTYHVVQLSVCVCVCSSVKISVKRSGTVSGGSSSSSI